MTIPTATVAKKQGTTMGTVIVKVTDPDVQVADVFFYTKVGIAGETGPYPPDILRRPSPGVYEKDIVLDTDAGTVIRTDIILVDGSHLSGLADQTFTTRDLSAVVGGGGGTTLLVQDADTIATAASILAFQGSVVSVANGVATVDLDSRFATLSGATFAGDVSTGGGRAVLGMDTFNGNARLELGSSAVGGTIPYIDFHYGVGVAQDFNARLMNNGNNLLTVAFAGVGQLNVQGTIQQNGTDVSLLGHTHDSRYLALGGGTVTGALNVQGTLQQNGTAVSLAGHTHDTRYLALGGGTVTGQVMGTVFGVSGPAAAFNVVDRNGAGTWAMYATGSQLRWFSDAVGSDRMTVSTAGNLAVAGSLQAAGANGNWGGALLSDRADWGGTLHPTVSSSGGGGLIMLARPHIPVVSGAAYEGDGAYVRMASDAAVTHVWDMGTVGDRFVVRRDGATPVLSVDASRATYLDRTDNWANDIPDGRYHLHLRSAADTRKRLVMGYSDGGTGAGFGFITAGQVNVAWTPLALQPTGGNVGIGTATPASALHLQGDRYATFGPNSTWGASFKVGSGVRPDGTASLFATNGNVHLDSMNGGYSVLLNYYSGGNVMVGNVATGAYRLNVDGVAYASTGFVSGATQWLASTQHGSTVHGTGSFIHTRSANGVIVQDQPGNTRGYVAYDATSFGLMHSGGDWSVRVWSGVVELKGRTQDEAGNPYAISLSGTANPTGAAREGALYIQY